MQKTAFPFEIVIHDDASTDKTQSILRRYRKLYPKKITLIIEKENKHSKNNLEFIDKMLKKSNGKYIALCEGDDYWTDPLKLQKQVDYMELNPDTSLCFHPDRVFFQGSQEEDTVFPAGMSRKEFTLERLVESNFIQTNSVMYRKQKYDDLCSGVMPNDLYLHLYHLRFGKIGFINEIMADHRRHSDGLWWDNYKDMDNIYINHHNRLVAFFDKVLSMYPDNIDVRRIVGGHVQNLIDSFLRIDNVKSTNLVRDTVHGFPDVIHAFIVDRGKAELRAKDDARNMEARIQVMETNIRNYELLLREYNDSTPHKIVRRICKAVSVSNKNLAQDQEKKSR